MAQYFSLPVSVHDDDDDETLAGNARRPGDSQYELPVANRDANDDSQVDVAAISAGDDISRDEFPAMEEDSSSVEIVLADPRLARFIDPWGRRRFGFTLAMGVLSIAILGYFVVQAILGARTSAATIGAVIAGGAGLTGILLVLLSIAGSSPRSLLGELAKSLRPTGPRSDLDRPIVSK